MLMEDYAPKLDEEAIRLINTVKYNAKRMGQLVDDLLEFSRMGKKDLNETFSSLDILVRNIINELSQDDKDPIKFIVHPLGMVYADHSLMQNVFHNLISNAIKYSSKKENPVIEVGVKETTGAKVYFVRDNGAGFDMAYYNKLFGVFHRLHRQDEFHGTGVGLAIVQRIILRHGGKIWAEGKVNEGATFYFSLDNSTHPKKANQI
jgi:light-regulated signal transduction histidine kinase (bacteriophytochrome)